MESDLPLIEMAEEDDSLIQQFPDLDQTSSLSYSTFALPPSHAKNLRDRVHIEKPSSSSSEFINNKENINSNSVEVPKIGMEPIQMKRRKKGIGYNLRKSLAWNRAFFTDEGILDPLQLTLITGIDANTCGGGLPTLREEGSSSFSSDVRCTDELNDMEASEEALLKDLRDKNHTSKGNREKTGCSMRNHDSLLHRKVTNKVRSSSHTTRGESKLGGCSEPLAASSLKRPANSNTLKTEKKESKLPKLPLSKPGPFSYATTKGSMAASQLRHNLIAKPTTKVENSSRLKSSLQNAHGSQSKAKTGSGNLHFPVKELAKKTVKNLTHSPKAASSIRSELTVQVDTANSRSELVQDSLQLCKVLEESAPLAAKHRAQHAAANSNDSLPEATRLTSSGSYHIQRASKGQMISNRLHPCESQERPAELARPSGLRMPSPSLRLFDLRTDSKSGSLQKTKIQHYMGSDRKIGKLRPPVRLPMKSNDITKNICSVVLTSSTECCAPSTQLSPSPNYMLKTSTKGVTDSNTHQILVTKSVPREDIKLEYEGRDSEQQKRILGHEEVAATWKSDGEIKVSHPTEQLTENVGTYCQLMPGGRVPEAKYKYVLYNKRDGLQSCTAFTMSTFGQSIQHQEENISIGVNGLAQTSWEQADTEKSDDASSKVKPVFHLDACSQLLMEPQEQDEIGKRDNDVGTTKCVAPGIEIYSAVLRHGQENNVSKVVDGKSLLTEEDDSSCSRTVNITFRDSHSLEDEADVIELKCTDTSCISFQNLNAEQRNDDVHDVDAFHTTTTITTSPRVSDPSAEEANSIHINPAISIRDKVQLHDSPVRDTVTQLLNHNPSAEGFHIIPTTSIKNKSQLQDTGSADGFLECFDATAPCISALLNSQLSVSCTMPTESSCLEEGTFLDVADTNDRLFQEKGVSSAIHMEIPGHKHDGVDVDLIPGEVAPLIDDQNQSSGFSHLRPQVEIICETASLGDDTFVKRESLQQGVQCTSMSPNVIDINDHTSQEKGVSCDVLMEVLGQKQDGVDVDLIPREVAPLIDDQNRSNNLSHLRPHVEIISETASLGDGAFFKRESVLQGAQRTSTFPNVTDINDHLSQENGVSCAILIGVPGQKQDGVDVDLIPREVGPSIDDQSRSSGLSHLRPHVEIISETASLGADTFVKRESVLQVAQCTSTYPQSLENKRVNTAASTVIAQHKISKKNHKSQEIGIIVAEKSQDPCGIVSETKTAVQGGTSGLKTYSQFQSENEAIEGYGPISSIFKTNVEDGQVQLLDGDVSVQSCSSLTSEVHNHSIENADHSDILGHQAEFSNTGIKLERASQSNECLQQQQESVCNGVWNVVVRSDVYECDPRPSKSVDTVSPVIEVVSNSNRQLCVEYRTTGSIGIDSPECHENHSDWQPAESADLTLNLDSELEQSVKDKMFVKGSTCMEYCSAGKKSCSFPTDSMLEEKTTLFLDDRVLMNDRLLSTEKIMDSVIPEVNTNASAQSLTTVQVNRDDQPQGFVGIMSSVETYNYCTNTPSDLSLSASQQLTTGVKTKSTPELCCLNDGGDESLLTKTTKMIGLEGSKISIGEQVDATPIVGEFRLELDDVKDHKDATVLMKNSNSIKRQDNSLVIHPPNAVPFSDEWLTAFEAAGEEILTMKCGAVQHSPQDKSLPEPGPWSPVKKKANQIGPYDCTKYMNAAMPSNSQFSD